jgi:hypothetical protein
MGITRVSNQLWMEPLHYESCPLGIGWCVAHAWPTPSGSCVAHTHPSCWVPVSVPQDKSPQSQEIDNDY